ncbi:MAG TPA: hypothetical protein VE861_02025 [Gemmatimonadaceae bacterium]|nr:hypothetical protein [Gemmatimonadaceae bacterium]
MSMTTTRFLLRPVTCAVALLLAAGTARAQAGAVRIPASARICDMSIRVVTMRLVDRRGAPIGDAAVTLRRVRRRAIVAGAESMGAGGDYKLIEDGMLRDLRPGGEPFDVTFAAGGRKRTVRVVLGLDAGQCHVALKSGPTKVTL